MRMIVERSVSKPALITPSASPPSRSFFPQPYRIPDKASPTKRPRLASTSSHLQHLTRSSSSSSTSLDQIDVHQAREASTLRLFDVWSTLAERYSRSLDEDDIIDITTGEVVKDRGVLRGSRNWDIGCFADNVGEEEEEEEEEEEDDVDELDSFADPGGSEELGGVLLDVNGRRVPPVTEMDPADAEDLKQFLEAERRRREVCGSEEETGDSEGESVGEGDLGDESLRDSVHSGDTGSSPFEQSATPQAEKDGLHVATDQTPRREPSVYVDSGSDDELVNWDLDEASMIYRLPKQEGDEEDRDSDIEFIEAPFIRPRSPSPPHTKLIPNPQAPDKKAGKPLVKSKKSKLAQAQLQTPPQSQSSFNSSATPSGDYPAPLPPEPSFAPLSSSPAPSHDDSSPIKPRQSKSYLRKPDHKPQRSAASQIDLDALPPPIPRLDLTKVAQEKIASKSNTNFKPTLRPRTKQKAPEVASTSSIPEKAVDISEPLSRSGETPLAPKRRRSQVEVVIEQRRPFSRTPLPDSHIKGRPVSEKEENVSATKSSAERSLVKDTKGKGREIVEDDPQEGVPEADDESDDPITIFSSPPVSVSEGTGRSQSSPDSSLRSAANKEKTNFNEPPNLKYSGVSSSAASIGRKKRKRVPSSSTEFETAALGRAEKLPVATRREELPVSRKRTESIGSESSVSTFYGEPETRPKPTRKSTPVARSRSSSKPGPSNHHRSPSPASSQDGFSEPDYRFHRAPSHFDPQAHSDPPYYSYHQPPYTPHHPHHPPPHQPHLYPPMADPRAQYIISQAMHQLSALVAGPWTPPTHGSAPYTPSHRHHPGGPALMYSTPTHHPHLYPYAYDPNLSRATLPPDSPDVPSSPIVPGGSSVRRKSLVKRSRSRGRRVSFRVEEEHVDSMEIHSGMREQKATSREGDQSRVLPAVHNTIEGKGKGKAKANAVDLGSEPEPEPEPEMPRRGRSFSRAQTPGPPIHTQPSTTRPDHGDQSTSSNSRGRSRSIGAAGCRR